MQSLAAAKPREEVPSLSRAVRPRHVLVVDDNRDALESLVNLLECEGHKVRAASDGEEALKLASDDHPDVVLLDLGMPRVDGFSVARQIRSAPWGATVALIAVTGFGQETDRRRTLLTGFDAHLVKPATFAQIREAIEAATESRADRAVTTAL